MSFILDALKKVEQEREQASVPDLMTFHFETSEEQKKRSLIPYIILLVLLINAGILTALLIPDKLEKQEFLSKYDVKQKEPIVNKQEKEDSETKLHASAASSVTEKAPVIESESTVEKASPEPVTAAAEKAGPSAAGAIKEKPSLPESDKIRAMPEQPPQPADTIASLGLNPSAKEIELLRSAIKEEREFTEDSSPSEPVPVKVIKSKSEKKVIEYGRLPSNIKKELPTISIKAHIYSNDPSSRIANVNGIIIREGDNVIKGLKVQKITMSGIIFNYGSYRFRMRAF